MRLALTTILCLVVALAFVSSGFAEDKEVTLDGKITCAKCELKVSGQTKCATVIVVKADGKDVIYYFDEKGDKAHHKEICTEGKPGKVVGKVSEKDGKKFITVAKVEFAKK